MKLDMIIDKCNNNTKAYKNCKTESEIEKIL